MGAAVLPRVLVATDADDLRAAIPAERFRVHAETGPAWPESPRLGDVDVVVIDCGMQGAEEQSLPQLRALFPDAPLLLVGPPGETSIEPLLARTEADDGLARPFDPRALERRLRLLVELGRSRRLARQMPASRGDDEATPLDPDELLCGDLPHVDLPLTAPASGDAIARDAIILEELHAAVIATDVDGKIVYANRTACVTLGIARERCLGANLLEVIKISSDGQSGLPTEPGKVLRLSHELRHPDGRSMDLGLSISCAEPGPHRLGHLITFRDLATMRQIELEDRRFERLATMGTMATGFAHEVRNPLASLRILGEALEAELGGDDYRHAYLSRIMLQVDRIERLVKTSLQFGRPEPPRRAAHAPATLTAAAIEALSPRTTELGPLDTEIEPDLPRVYVDDGQVVQVLIILLNNAIDATGSSQKARLHVRRSRSVDRRGCDDGDEIRFEVIDTGPGIPKHMLSLVFDPFFTTKRSGTGLGLAIAQQLVHENGGRLEVTSTPGQGTTFALVIPGACA